MAAAQLQLSKVYPRTGGGNVAAAIAGLIFLGLSPHGRGKRAGAVVP